MVSKLEGNLEDAVPDLDAANRLNPRYLDALNARGEVRRRLGNGSGAVADWKEALRVAPRDWKQWAAVEASLRAAEAGN